MAKLALVSRSADRRYLLVCLVGAAVSAAAAWAALVGLVPLTVVPASVLVAGVCTVLAFEWLFAAVLVAARAERPTASPEPAEATSPPEPAPVSADATGETAPAETATGETASAEATAGTAAETAALQERIGQLTAALTLTAAAEDLQQVGAIVQHALTADLRLAEARPNASASSTVERSGKVTLPARS